MNLKVLLVDDEKNIREVLKYGLSVKGIFDIEEAENGSQACMKAMLLKPDIILLDVNMPLMDGIQAYGKLKEDPDTRHIPVILFTAKPMLMWLKKYRSHQTSILRNPAILKNFIKNKKDGWQMKKKMSRQTNTDVVAGKWLYGRQLGSPGGGAGFFTLESYR